MGCSGVFAHEGGTNQERRENWPGRGPRASGLAPRPQITVTAASTLPPRPGPLPGKKGRTAHKDATNQRRGYSGDTPVNPCCRATDAVRRRPSPRRDRRRRPATKDQRRRNARTPRDCHRRFHRSRTCAGGLNQTAERANQSKLQYPYSLLKFFRASGTAEYATIRWLWFGDPHEAFRRWRLLCRSGQGPIERVELSQHPVLVGRARRLGFGDADDRD